MTIRVKLSNMSACTLSFSDLEAYLPHRGVNVIPDSVSIAEDGLSAQSVAQILPDDPRGRLCFGRHDASGQPFWNEPFLAELLALTGIPLLADWLRQEGKVAVFSSISRVRIHQPAPLHARIVCDTTLTRQRAGFAQFAASIEADGEAILQAEIMSGSAAMADILAASGGGQQPALEAGQVQLPWPWKPASCTFIDRILEIDPQQGSIRAGYRYPKDHLFVPTHFPDAPLMMGVTEWTAMADALAALLLAQKAADGRYCGQCSITRPDGTEVVSARDLVIELESGLPRCADMQRILFHEVVLPGDELIILAQLS